MKIYVKTESPEVINALKTLNFQNSEIEVSTGSEREYLATLNCGANYSLVLEASNIKELESKMILEALKNEAAYSLYAA